MAESSQSEERIQCVIETQAKLTGLNQTIALLRGLEAALDRVTGKFSRMSAGSPVSGFKTIRQQIETMQKAGASLKPIDLSKAFGLKLDRHALNRELDAFAAEMRAQGVRVRKIFESAGSQGAPLSGRAFRTPELAAQWIAQQTRSRQKAAEVVSQWTQVGSSPAHPTPAQVAVEALRQPAPRVTMASIHAGPAPVSAAVAPASSEPPPPRPPVAAAVIPPGEGPEGRIRLTVRGQDIEAILIPPVRLEIPGSQIVATVVGPIQATATAAVGAAAPGSAATSGVAGQILFGEIPAGRDKPGELPTLRGEISRTISGATTRITQAVWPGETVTRTLTPEGERGRTIRRRTGARSPEQEFEYQINQALKEELAAIQGRAKVLKTQATPETLATLATETRATAQRLQAAFTSHAESLLSRAGNAAEQGAARSVIDPAQAAMDRRILALNAEAQRLELKAAELRARIAKENEAALNRVRETGALQRQRLDREREVSALAEEKRRDSLRSRQVVQMSGAEAESLIERSQAEGLELVGGAPRTKRRTTERGAREVEEYRFTLPGGGQRIITVEREARPPSPPTPPKPPVAGGAPAPEPGRGPIVSSSIEEKPAKGPGIGQYALSKFKALATYAGEAMILYGALEEARKAMESMIQTSLETARLSQVFKGVGGTARDLINDVIELSAAEGKSAKDAEASAVSWARLGLTRRQIDEAVRVSLQAANIADVQTAVATEHLQTVMAAYQLRVEDLGGVLGAINSVSQQYKVTQSQLFDALSRTASVAKQTGLPFEELNGILGVLISKTGQTGVAVGNTVATLMASLSRPDVQKFLREEFKLELTVGGGAEIQSMSDRLANLFVAYQRMNRIQRENLATHLLGARQITRLTAFFDSYLQAQVAAVNAQLRLNSAEETSARIRATLHSRLIGLRAEMERFAAVADQKTGLTSSLAEWAEGATNVLRIIQAIGGAVNDLPETIGEKLGLRKTGAQMEGTRQFQPQSPIIETLKATAGALGGPSAEAEKRIAALDERIRKSGGSVKAYSAAISVYRMAMESLLSLPKETGLLWAKQLGELGTIKGPEQFKTQLDVAVRTKNQSEVSRIFADQIQAAQVAVEKSMSQRVADVAKQKGRLQIEIKRLQDSPRGKTQQGQKEIQSLEEQALGLNQKLLQVWEDEKSVLERNAQAVRDMVASDVKHHTFLESQKETVQAIAELYRTIAHTTPLEEHLGNISALEYQVGALKEALSKIEAEYDRAAEQAAKIKERGGVPNEYGTPLPRLEEERKAVRQQLIERQGELEGARLNTPNFAAISNAMIAREIASSQARAFEYGATEVDRLRRRHAALMAMTEERAQFIASPSTAEADRNAALVQQAEQLAELSKTRLELEKHRLDVLQQEYDFNRKLLTSGPAELLQRIVAQRLTASGRPMQAGQFMALSPQMRENVLEAADVARGHRFMLETPPMTERQRWINEPAARLAAVNEQIQRAQPVKGAPIESTFGSITTGTATVIGKTILVQGLNAAEPSAAGGKPAPKASPEALQAEGQTGRPAGAASKSFPQIAWDVAQKPALQYLPTSLYHFLTARESGKRISQATGIPRTVADIGAGTLNAAAEASERMTSPVNIASMALWPFKVARLAFGAGALVDLKTKVGQGVTAYKQGDLQGSVEAMAGALLDVLMAKSAAKGYRGAKGPDLVKETGRTTRELLLPEKQPEMPTPAGESTFTQTARTLAGQEPVRIPSQDRWSQIGRELQPPGIGPAGQPAAPKSRMPSVREAEEAGATVPESWRAPGVRQRATPGLMVGTAAALATGAGMTRTEAATEPAKPAEQRRSIADEASEAIRRYAAENRITIANQPNIPTGASLDNVEIGKANLALAQFTMTVGRSTEALDRLTTTVDGLKDSFVELADGVDELAGKFESLMPNPNAGPPALNYAD